LRTHPKIISDIKASFPEQPAHGPLRVNDDNKPPINRNLFTFNHESIRDTGHALKKNTDGANKTDGHSKPPQKTIVAGHFFAQSKKCCH
jgi:hypothetical protein